MLTDDDEVRSFSLMFDRNGGGTDSFILPSITSSLEKDQGYDSLDWDDDGMEISYTSAMLTCALRTGRNRKKLRSWKPLNCLKR